MPADNTGISTLTYNALLMPAPQSIAPAYNNAQQWNALSCRLPATVNAAQLLPDVGKLTSNGNTTYTVQIHQGGNATGASYKSVNG